MARNGDITPKKNGAPAFTINLPPMSSAFDTACWLAAA